MCFRLCAEGALASSWCVNLNSQSTEGEKGGVFELGLQMVTLFNLQIRCLELLQAFRTY